MSAAPEFVEFSQQELGFLRQCSPLKHFDDAAFQAAVLSARASNLKPDEVLFEGRQRDNIGYYLLAGEVRIFDKSGESFEIAGGALEAFYPITAHIDARVKCVALSAVRYAALSMDDLANIEVQSRAFDVQEISDEDESLDERILVEVFHAIQTDELILPSLPEVATKIRAAAEDDNVGVGYRIRIAAAEVESLVRNALGEILVDFRLFDVYQGKGIDSNEKSLAIGLTLQSQEATLTEEEIGKYTQSAVTALESGVKARLR